MKTYEEMLDEKGYDAVDFLSELDESLKQDLIDAILDDNGDILGVKEQIMAHFREWCAYTPDVDQYANRGDQQYEINKDNELNPTGENDGC